MAEEKPKSVLWVTFAGVALIGYVGWGFMAAGYAADIEERYRASLTNKHQLNRVSRMGVAVFVINSVAQLPNASAVISSAFERRVWMPIMFTGLVGLMLAGGVFMKVLEMRFAALDDPRRPRKRKTPEKKPSW